MKYKYFVNDGSGYLMKPPYIWKTMVCIMFFGLFLLLAYFHQYVFAGILLFIATLVFVMILSKKINIDIDKKEIRVKQLANTIIIPIDKVDHLKFTSVKYIFITICSEVSVFYTNEKGIRSEMSLAIGGRKKTLQHFLNEIEEIIDETKDS